MENQELEPQRENERERMQGRGNGFAAGLICGVLLIVLSVALCVGVILPAAGSRITITGRGNGTASSLLTEEVTKRIDELTGYINLYYYEDAAQDKLKSGLYSGLFQGLGDPYSAYYTPEQYQELQISATQKYYGIGAGLAQNKNTMEVTVSYVYPGSPAEEAGLKAKDTILKVEDIDGTSMELSELVTHIRGEEGTSVHLEVYREGEKELLEFDVARKNIDLPTVDHKLLNGNIGYIHILDFGAATAKQFEEAAAELNSQGMQAMILDVRDNPGGMVTAVTKILDDILPEGTVVYTQDKYGNRKDFTSDEENKMELPITVLMNGNSASASEILAGAIRDFKYGTLVGTTTFGKGIVQGIYELEDGSAIKLTTSKYYTPDGENIHGVGIKPDVELEYKYEDPEATEYDEQKDNQVLKAIEILQKELENGKN